MKEIVTCARMKALDEYTINTMGIPSCTLMERAALAVADEIGKLPREALKRVLVVCGSGNNGGDGMAAARILQLRGIPAEIFFAGNPDKMTEETARQWRIALNYRVPTVNNPQWDEYTTIVDAVFGIGLTRPIEGKYEQLIREMNGANAKKVAVDIPSGINGDDGRQMGIAFRADLTVTFACRKRGLCFYPGRMFGGRIVVADIGVYSSASDGERAWHLEQEDLERLPKRVPYGNKGTFGKVLLVAGSEGMCGAAYLAADAALHAGAGMVKIQTVEENRIPLQVLLPEAMVSWENSREEYCRLLDWCDVLVIGPGLGVSEKSWEREQWFLEKGSEAGKPIILDADGLNLLAVHPAWKKYLGERVVVTPHLGEMSRLMGKTIKEIQASMTETAQEYAKETGCVCVLKDACTVVSDGKGQMFLNLSGNAGMATAGSGDVLSGILAAVWCMYLKTENQPDSLEKAALGVYLHGRCGDAAALTNEQYSMTARDLIRALPRALSPK